MGVTPAMRQLLERTGTVAELGEDAVVDATPEVMGGLDDAVAAAERWVQRPRGDQTKG